MRPAGKISFPRERNSRCHGIGINYISGIHLDVSGSTRSKEGGVRQSMQVEIKIDNTCKEPRIIVVTDQLTDEIHALVSRLSEEFPRILSGFRNDTLEVLEQSDIFRLYASAGKVYAVTSRGEYTLRLRLYELEERLEKDSFVRISNSEIINLKKVKNFDLSFTGTICVSLSDGTVTYVSRRYVNKIKQILGI